MDEEFAKALTDILLTLKKAVDDLITLIAKTQVKPVKTLEDLKRLTPSDLFDLLEFEEGDDRFVIKPKGFLGYENFMKLAKVVRSLGGDYVSAGKDSRFEVPRARGV